MPVSGALQRLVRRMFLDGRAPVAVAFRREFRALEQRLGPFDDVTAQHAAGVVTFALEFQSNTADLQRLQEARARGRGRRPTAAAVERMRRRQGLSWGSYESALRRLEELAPHRRGDGPDLHDLLNAGEPGTP